MDLLNFFSELFLFASPSKESRNGRRNRHIRILTKIILIVGILWFVLEVQNIQYLKNPLLFLGFALIAYIIISILIIVALFKAKAFDSLNPTDFWLFLFALTLTFIAAT